MLAEAAKRQRTGQFFSGLIYAHQLSITIGHATEDLQILATIGELKEFENRVEFLPL